MICKIVKHFKKISELMNTTILPSRVRFQKCQIFSTVFTLETILRKLDSSFILLLFQKYLQFWQLHYLDQWISYHRLPLETFSGLLILLFHILLLCFNLEKREKVFNISTKCAIDCECFRKKLCHLPKEIKFLMSVLKAAMRLSHLDKYLKVKIFCSCSTICNTRELIF